MKQNHLHSFVPTVIAIGLSQNRNALKDIFMLFEERKCVKCWE